MPPSAPQPLHELATAIAAGFRSDAAAELRLGGPEAALRAMILEALARLVDTLALMLRDWSEGRLPAVAQSVPARRKVHARTPFRNTVTPGCGQRSKDSPPRHQEAKARTPSPSRPCLPSLRVFAVKNRPSARPPWNAHHPTHSTVSWESTPRYQEAMASSPSPLRPCLSSLGAFAVKTLPSARPPWNAHHLPEPPTPPNAKTASNAGRLRTSILLRNRTKPWPSAAAAPSPAPHQG
jgi:hypothetical protein